MAGLLGSSSDLDLPARFEGRVCSAGERPGGGTGAALRPVPQAVQLLAHGARQGHGLGQAGRQDLGSEVGPPAEGVEESRDDRLLDLRAAESVAQARQPLEVEPRRVAFPLLEVNLEDRAPLALGLLFVRSALSQMDVPTRTAYVMAVVTPAERAAAASFTAVPRSLAAALSPALAGALFAASFRAWPLIICGALKIIYDLLLLIQFRHVKPPEEH